MLSLLRVPTKWWLTLVLAKNITALGTQNCPEVADAPNPLMSVSADEVRASLDFRVQPLQRVGAVDLRPVRPREGHEGQHVVLGVIHQSAKLGNLSRSWSATPERSPLRSRGIG